MAFNFRPEVIVESMPLLVKGLEMTLLITVGGLALGLFLGVVTGLTIPDATAFCGLWPWAISS